MELAWHIRAIAYPWDAAAAENQRIGKTRRRSIYSVDRQTRNRHDIPPTKVTVPSWKLKARIRSNCASVMVARCWRRRSALFADSACRCWSVLVERCCRRCSNCACRASSVMVVRCRRRRSALAANCDRRSSSVILARCRRRRLARVALSRARRLSLLAVPKKQYQLPLPK